MDPSKPGWASDSPARASQGLRPHLHVGRARPLGALAEVGVVVLYQRLEVIGFLEAAEHLLARKLVDRHVLEFVVAKDLAVAARADGAVVLQQLRRMLLVVPAVEGRLLVLGDGR